MRRSNHSVEWASHFVVWGTSPVSFGELRFQFPNASAGPAYSTELNLAALMSFTFEYPAVPARVVDDISASSVERLDLFPRTCNEKDLFSG
jgi:hypothetical protein